MKTLLFLTSLLFFVQPCLSSVNDSLENEQSVQSKAKIKSEQITKLSALKYADQIYFNLSIKNEAEDVWYVLLKTCEDGSSESVGMKKGHSNELNTALSYSFKDSAPADCNVTYTLLKVGEETSTEMISWTYSKEFSEQKRIALPVKIDQITQND